MLVPFTSASGDGPQLRRGWGPGRSNRTRRQHQATEALKYFLGIGDSLSSRLLLIDALSMSFREVRLKRNPKCPLCGDSPTVTELIDYEVFCGVAEPQHEPAAAALD